MTRKGRRRSEKPGDAAAPRVRRAAGLLLFAFALALRLLFWQATPDAAGSHSAAYKGDAPTWLAYARSLQTGQPFELGLPLRPPGNGYLIAGLWNGERDGVAALRFWWCLLGALTVPLIYGAARRSFGFPTALVTGLLCAASTGLMVLSASLNNETPYLLLVTALLYLWQPVLRRPRPAVLALWSVLHGAACLLRVEHALFFGLVSLYLAWVWARSGAAGSDQPPAGWRAVLGRLAVLGLVFGLVLAPWHLHAWSAIRRFNSEPLAANPATERAQAQIEQALAGLVWEPAAFAERDAIPACCRRTAGNFVAATVAVRGGRTVSAADFEILDQAFGSRPRPLGGHPFVVLYGGLNFYLANNPRAEGGFGRDPLERPPPLAGGAGRYPAPLVQGLPPPQLTLTYPPHLEIVNRGYRLGWDWIRDHPAAYLELAGEKLRIFWRGAALGAGGYGLPLGLSGVRRTVDLAVPQGTAAALWRLAVLVLAGFGLYAGRRRMAALMPWLLFLASRLAVTLAFYGYARFGATVIPVVALLAALAAGRWIEPADGSARRDGRWLRAAAGAALLLLAVEAVRFASAPEVFLDRRRVTASEPFPTDEYRDRTLQVK